MEPCREEKWTKADVKQFLDEYKKKAHQLPDVCRYFYILLVIFYILSIFT